MSTTDAPIPAPDGAIAQPAEKKGFDLGAVMAQVGALFRKPVFLATFIGVLAIVFCFGPLIPELRKRWLDMDSYYAHGLLIPLCAIYLIWERWEKIKALPVKPFLFALVPLALVLYVSLSAARAIMPMALSVLLITALLLSVLFVAGWRWMVATSPGILFLSLGMPIFDRVIDSTTMPLQIHSTTIAYYGLKVAGLDPYREDPTIILLDNFQLYVAAACSGLKTTIAVSAAVIFFMLIARLRWWANLILAVVAIPLSVLINGIRIFLIGVVGNTWGSDAGMKFHDYSGYIALALCFVILGWITKKLGYK